MVSYFLAHACLYVDALALLSPAEDSVRQLQAHTFPRIISDAVLVHTTSTVVRASIIPGRCDTQHVDVLAICVADYAAVPGGENSRRSSFCFAVAVW